MTERLCVDIITKSPRWHDALPNVAALAQQAADIVWRQTSDGQLGAELSLVLGDDAFLKSLNYRYRKKNQPTNILSFPAEDEVMLGMPRLLGDVVLAFETIYLEAVTQEKTFADHFQHLFVHGFLHLLGHDHQDEADAASMAALEIDFLLSLGIVDPYAGRPMTRPR
jgi:probable rRNA maturation factor